MIPRSVESAPALADIRHIPWLKLLLARAWRKQWLLLIDSSLFWMGRSLSGFCRDYVRALFAHGCITGWQPVPAAGLLANISHASFTFELSRNNPAIPFPTAALEEVYWSFTSSLTLFTSLRHHFAFLQLHRPERNGSYVCDLYDL